MQKFDTTFLDIDNGGSFVYHEQYGFYLYGSRNNFPTSLYPVISKISGPLTKLTGQTEIKVFNILGQLIQTIPIIQKDFEVQINLSQNGLYLVNLYQGNPLVQSEKWVVR